MTAGTVWVHLHLGQHQRHFQRMHQVRLARGAGLALMVFQRVIVGFLDNGQIVLRPGFPESASSARGTW